MPTQINDSGQISGLYLDATFAEHAFLREFDGTITTFDAPSSASVSVIGTGATGINNLSQIAGGYTDSSFQAHGFIAAQPVAQLPQIAPPPPPLPGTAPAIKRLKPELCLHELGDLGAFFQFAAAIGLGSGISMASKQVGPIAKAVIPIVQAIALVGLGGTYVSCIMDPFDPNFTVRYEPQFHTFPPVPPSADIPVALARRLTDAIRHGSRAASFIQAVNVSLNRYASALQAHDAASASLQEQAVLDYVRLSSDELESFTRDLRESAELAHETSLDQPVSTDDVRAAFDRIRTQGAVALPAIEQGIFRMFGLDPSLLLTGGPSREPPIRREESERLERSFSSALENIANVMDRLGHALREGLSHHD